MIRHIELRAVYELSCLDVPSLDKDLATLCRIARDNALVLRTCIGAVDATADAVALPPGAVPKLPEPADMPETIAHKVIEFYAVNRPALTTILEISTKGDMP